MLTPRTTLLVGMRGFGLNLGLTFTGHLHYEKNIRNPADGKPTGEDLPYRLGSSVREAPVCPVAPAQYPHPVVTWA